MLLTDKYDIFFDEENNAYQVRTKNDVVIIEFSDSEKESIFNDILCLYERKEFYTLQQINKKLKSKYPYEKVLDVIQELQDCSLLTPDNFENEEVENVSIGQNKGALSRAIYDKQYSEISEVRLGFIGEKELGEKIRAKAEEYGYRKVYIQNIDDKIETLKIRSVFENNDFIIIDSSKWNPVVVEVSNKIALELQRPWLLIEGLIDFQNYSIGPIFYGKETGCYECYNSRLRSNDEFLAYTKSYESYLRKNEKHSQPDEIPKLVKDFISCVVVIDISKFIGKWYIPETWRANIVINTSNFSISKHSFLKAPICYTCNPCLDYNQYPWLESVTLKED